MDTKSLLIGVLSFIAGALLVSIAATTFEKTGSSSSMSANGSHSKSELTAKNGEAFDQAFLEEMIVHHQGAVEMAQLAQDKAERKEIKDLSVKIISDQEAEIKQMKQWQREWGSQTL